MLMPAQVRLVAAFPRPVDVAVAAARSCYSPQLVPPAKVAGEHLAEEEARQAAATSAAGTHRPA
ncbi:MAG: hypothetical protein ACOY7U_03435 [Acidobacteriota bacterium]